MRRASAHASSAETDDHGEAIRVAELLQRRCQAGEEWSRRGTYVWRDWPLAAPTKYALLEDAPPVLSPLSPLAEQAPRAWAAPHRFGSSASGTPVAAAAVDNSCPGVPGPFRTQADPRPRGSYPDANGLSMKAAAKLRAAGSSPNLRGFWTP